MARYDARKPQLSAEQRWNIVRWRYEDKKPVPEIAHLARCDPSTVYRVLSTFNVHGNVYNPEVQARCRHRVLDMNAVNFVLSEIRANPAIYLDEIQRLLIERLEVHVSIATLSRTIHRLGHSHKLISSIALQRNELLCSTWIAEYGDIPKNYFVWLDESSVDNLTHQRLYGWAPIGLSCVRRTTTIRGERFSILPALTTDGIIALDIFIGSVTKDIFIQFLEEELVRFDFPCS